MLRSLDLSIAQDVFRNVGGQRNGFQIRADILNFGNLLNQQLGRRAAAGRGDQQQQPGCRS